MTEMDELKPAGVTEVRDHAIAQLHWHDDRTQRVHDIIEELREIVLAMPADQRPEGLMKKAQDAVYGMRGRVRLLDDAAIVSALEAAAKAQPSLSPAGVTEEQVEAAARAIYAQQPNYGLGVRPNTSGGWSPTRFDDEWEDAPDRHDDCRRQARAALEAAAKAQPRDYTDFDTWFHEQEGVSLRSERFNGDVEWLKAAFDAGRSAQPSISTGQGEAEEWCCSKCGCRSHARVDERQSDGRFAPGSRVRCVHCKDVSYFPSLPAGHVAVPVEPTEAMLAEAMREADRRGYQHTKGYINEDDARYLYAAMLAALPHSQGGGK